MDISTIIKVLESAVFITVGLMQLYRDFPWLARSLIDIPMVFVGAATFVSLWVQIPYLDGLTFFTLALWIISHFKKGEFYAKQ